MAAAPTPAPTSQPPVPPVAKKSQFAAFSKISSTAARADPADTARASKVPDNGVTIMGLVMQVIRRDKPKGADANAQAGKPAKPGEDVMLTLRVKIIKPVKDAISWKNPNYAKWAGPPADPKAAVMLVTQYRCHKDHVHEKFPEFHCPPLGKNAKWVSVPLDPVKWRNDEYAASKLVQEGDEIFVKNWSDIFISDAQGRRRNIRQGDLVRLLDVSRRTQYNPSEPVCDCDPKENPKPQGHPCNKRDFMPSHESTIGEIIPMEPQEMFFLLRRYTARNPRCYPVEIDEGSLPAEALEELKKAQEQQEKHDGGAAEDGGADAPKRGGGGGRRKQQDNPANYLDSTAPLLSTDASADAGALLGVTAPLDMNAATDAPAVDPTAAPVDPTAVPAGPVAGAAAEGEQKKGRDRSVENEWKKAMTKEVRDFVTGTMLLLTHPAPYDDMEVGRDCSVQWFLPTVFSTKEDGWIYKKKIKEGAKEVEEPHSKAEITCVLNQACMDELHAERKYQQSVTIPTHAFKGALDGLGIIDEKLQIEFMQYILPKTPMVFPASVDISRSLTYAKNPEMNRGVDPNTGMREFAVSCNVFNGVAWLAKGIMDAGYEVGYAEALRLVEHAKKFASAAMGDTDADKNRWDVPKPQALFLTNTRYRLKQADAATYRFFVVPNFEKSIGRVASLEKAIAAAGGKRELIWKELADSLIQDDVVDANGHAHPYKHPEWSIVPNKLKRDEHEKELSTIVLKYVVGIVSLDAAKRVQEEDEKVKKQPDISEFLDAAMQKIQAQQAAAAAAAPPAAPPAAAAAKPANTNVPPGPQVQSIVQSNPAPASTPPVAKQPPPEPMQVDSAGAAAAAAAAAAKPTGPAIALASAKPVDSDPESLSEPDEAAGGGTRKKRAGTPEVEASKRAKTAAKPAAAKPTLPVAGVSTAAAPPKKSGLAFGAAKPSAGK